MKMFTTEEMEKLEEILCKAADPDESFNAMELHGFFFGLAITPDPVMPSQWFPVVFGKDGPMFDDEKDAQSCVGYLMEIYNRFMAASNSKKLFFPFDYKKISRDWFPDLEDWAYGLFEALALRPEHWGLPYERSEGDIPEDMLDVMDACAVVSLAAFPDERISAFKTMPDSEPKSEEEMEMMVFGLLPVGVENLIKYGEKLRRNMFAGRPEAPDKGPVRREPKVGRNDLCPCGSGRKYKKCCGAN
jgi:uncharacterized protein